MKRTLAAVGCLLLIASLCRAGPKQNYQEFATTTNTSGSVTLNVSGYVEAVYVAVSDDNSTGTVAVTYAPLVGSSAISIATGAAVAEKVWRPRTDGTQVDGTANTSDPPERFPLVGELVTFAVTTTVTNVTWKIQIITNEN